MSTCARCEVLCLPGAWGLCQRCAALVNLFVERERPRFHAELAECERAEWFRYRALLIARAFR